MKVFKNKKQRFFAVFLSLVFAFMLVPFTDAYARDIAVVNQGTSYDFNYSGSKFDLNLSYSFSSPSGANIVIVGIKGPADGNITYGAYSLSSDIAFTVNSSTSHASSAHKTSVTIDGQKLYFVDYLNAYRNGGSNYTFIPTDFSFPYYLVNYYFDDNYNAIHYRYIVALLKAGDTTGFDCTHVGSEGGYSNEIGALKNVSRNTLYPDHANNVDSVFWRFRYASKTTKGYNVKTSGTKIRVYESVTYYKRFDDSVYSESPKVLVGEYDATSLQFDMDVNEAFNKTTSETDSQYIANAWTIMTKQIVRNDRIYLQVVDAKGNCGDYLRIGGHADNASNSTDNPQTVVDEDGNEVSEENGGYSTDDTDGDVGTSIDGDLDSADDDANSKPEEKENIGDSLDHAISTIRSLIDMIRHIPEIISILFSFLPPWCLSVVALGFVALVVLIAYKLIRG